ncbi:MAG: voltage-gated potassium channel [Solirubrobacteraceae bacterium]|nr:voltage-gated potassium channel [Solirubrobacteraceae bacterium]
MSRRSLRYLLPGALLVTILAGGGFAALETDAVGSYWEGLWWALSLVTTIGFAGNAPSTTAGKAVSALLMLLGFVVLAVTTAAVASLFVRDDERPEAARERAFEHEVLAELRRANARLEALEQSRRPSARDA